MMQGAAMEAGQLSGKSSNQPAGSPAADKRSRDASLFILIEIDRASVVDHVFLDDGHVPGDSADHGADSGKLYESDGVFAIGAMRELCPQCRHAHLKLILRQKRVRHAHLFCDCCSKCFDARYPDGSSALAIED